MYWVTRVHEGLVAGAEGPAVPVGLYEQPEPVHLRQGALDGACGQHCVFMALIALGLTTRDSLLTGSKRQALSGVSATKRLALNTWHEGASLYELFSLLAPIRKHVSVAASRLADGPLIRFVLTQLAQRRFVVIGIRNRDIALNHWVLAVGTAGMQDGANFSAQEILVLDPGQPCIPLAQWNSVLSVRPRYPRGRARVYWDTAGNEVPVMVRDGLAIGRSVTDDVP
jgi:hypothetical protein